MARLAYYLIGSSLEPFVKKNMLLNSQLGNTMFPHWEQNIPSLGINSNKGVHIVRMPLWENSDHR